MKNIVRFHSGIYDRFPLFSFIFLGWTNQSTWIIIGATILGHQIGASLGAFMVGIIYDYTNSYFWAFILSMVVLGLGSLLSLSVTEQQNLQISTNKTGIL